MIGEERRVDPGHHLGQLCKAWSEALGCCLDITGSLRASVSPLESRALSIYVSLPGLPPSFTPTPLPSSCTGLHPSSPLPPCECHLNITPGGAFLGLPH